MNYPLQDHHHYQQSARRTQEALLDRSLDLDMQLAELQVSAGHASQIALGSASDMVASSHQLGMQQKNAEAVKVSLDVAQRHRQEPASHSASDVCMSDH